MAAWLLSRLRAVAAAVVVVLAAGATVEAQDLEPRAYANTPVGLNFLLLGYGYQTGEVAFDPSTPIEDGELTAHGAFLAYARALNVWGRAGKLDVVLPYAWVSGTASVAGEPRDREVSGLADPRLGSHGLLRVDHRADVDALVEGIPDHEGLGGLRELVEEGLGDRLVAVHALHREADLAGVVEGAERAPLRDEIEVGVGGDDDG